MSGPSVTWMPVPAPQGYLVNPYKQEDTMTESSDYESIQVFIGVDVGKDTHHAPQISSILVAVTGSPCASLCRYLASGNRASSGTDFQYCNS